MGLSIDTSNTASEAEAKWTKINTGLSIDTSNTAAEAKWTKIDTGQYYKTPHKLDVGLFIDTSNTAAKNPPVCFFFHIST